MKVNYPAFRRSQGGASVLTGECRNLDFRPSVGLTSPPTAETAEPSAFSIVTWKFYIAKQNCDE
jgi:hypothetical protein